MPQLAARDRDGWRNDARQAESCRVELAGAELFEGAASRDALRQTALVALPLVVQRSVRTASA